MKNKILYAARILVTLLLIWLVVEKVDVSESFGLVRKINPVYFGVGFLAAIAGWVLNTLRWRQLLTLSGAAVSLGRLFLYNLIGVFYSIILPGGKLTGDAIIAYRSRNFISVLADRFLGFLAMIFILLAYFLFRHPAVEVFGSQAPILGLFFATVFLAGCALLFTACLDFLKKWLEKIPLAQWRPWVNSFFSALATCRANKVELFWVFLLSVAGAIFNMLAAYILSMAVGLNLSFPVVGFAYLLATLLVIVPITVAGIGLREGGLIYILKIAGAQTSAATALSLLLLGIFSLFALAGGIAELILVARSKKQ